MTDETKTEAKPAAADSTASAIPSDESSSRLRLSASSGTTRGSSCSAAPQHATTMFFPHFVGDACSRELDQCGQDSPRARDY
jgi:hypothetical protein